MKNLIAFYGVIYLTFIGSFLFAKQLNAEKILHNEWKLILAERNNKNIPPRHQNLVLVFHKNHTFEIHASYELTHKGEWAYNEEQNKMHLIDESREYDLLLDLTVSDKDNMSMQDYMYPDITLHFSKLKHHTHYHLNHKEHLLAKTWFLAKSTTDENEGTVFEFLPDKTFVIYTEFAEDDYIGSWKFDTQKNILYLENSEESGITTLFFDEISPHKITLTNPESGITNTFYDDVLVNNSSASNLKKLGLIAIPFAMLLLIPGQ